LFILLFFKVQEHVITRYCMQCNCIQNTHWTFLNWSSGGRPSL